MKKIAILLFILFVSTAGFCEVVNVSPLPPASSTSFGGIQGSSGSKPRAQLYEAGDIPDYDMKSLLCYQIDNNIKFRVGFRENDPSRISIFIDSDGNDKTGYEAKNISGADFLIQGETLMKFDGASADVWKWNQICGIKVEKVGSFFEFVFPASKINPSSIIRIAGNSTNPDWSNADWIPDSNPLEMNVDITSVFRDMPPDTASPDTSPSLAVTDGAKHKKIMERSFVIKNKPVKKFLKEVKTYVCYYGQPKIEQLSQFDLAIIEPSNYTADQIKVLKNSGTIVIGYISFGEQDSGPVKGDGKGPGGFASWYIDANNDDKPDVNPNWNSYYVNGNLAWQKFIIKERMKEVLEEKNCDGIFMDTLDTSELFESNRNNFVKLVKSAKESYPEKFSFSNRGFHLLPEIGPYIDGLMYEGFTSHESLPISHQVVRNILEDAVRDYGIFIISIDYVSGDDEIEKASDYYNRSWAYNMVPYVSVRALDRIFFWDDIKPDKDKQKKFANPHLTGWK